VHVSLPTRAKLQPLHDLVCSMDLDQHCSAGRHGHRKTDTEQKKAKPKLKPNLTLHYLFVLYITRSKIRRVDCLEVQSDVQLYHPATAARLYFESSRQPERQRKQKSTKRVKLVWATKVSLLTKSWSRFYKVV